MMASLRPWYADQQVPPASPSVAATSQARDLHDAIIGDNGHHNYHVAFGSACQDNYYHEPNLECFDQRPLLDVVWLARQAHKNGLDTIPSAHAAAASACFPPIFEPLDPKVAAGDFSDGFAEGADADRCRERIRLSDGGVYDNMGLEPLWKDVEALLVSDAGEEFEFSPDRGTISDIKR